MWLEDDTDASAIICLLAFCLRHFLNGFSLVVSCPGRADGNALVSLPPSGT